MPNTVNVVMLGQFSVSGKLTGEFSDLYSLGKNMSLDLDNDNDLLWATTLQERGERVLPLLDSTRKLFVFLRLPVPGDSSSGVVGENGRDGDKEPSKDEDVEMKTEGEEEAVSMEAEALDTNSDAMDTQEERENDAVTNDTEKLVVPTRERAFSVTAPQ